MDTKKKAWINLGLFVVTIIVNTLGGTGLINDTSQSDVSGRYQTLITPAGFTFSIWSVIYGLLAISLIVMIVKHQDAYYKEVTQQITPLLWVSFATNIIWIILFSYVQVGLSTVFIFAYLISLTLILQKLRRLSENRQWLVPLTFGLNTGWLFIASVVNISAFLVKIEWDGLGIADTTWAAIIMVVAVLLATAVLLNLQNAAFPLPIAWAFVGIYAELQSVGANGLLGVISLVSMVFLVILAVFMFIRNDKAIYPVQKTI